MYNVCSKPCCTNSNLIKKLHNGKHKYIIHICFAYRKKGYSDQHDTMYFFCKVCHKNFMHARNFKTHIKALQRLSANAYVRQCSLCCNCLKVLHYLTSFHDLCQYGKIEIFKLRRIKSVEN